MVGNVARSALWAGIAAAALAGPAAAQTLMEFSNEIRMQLDYRVNDAKLQAMLPAGWEQSIATAGPAKDCNIRVIFVDRTSIIGGDGKPLGAGTNRYVYLAAPVKQTATGIVGQMVIGGISADPTDAPGPFGVYIPASSHKVTRATAGSGRPGAQVEEHWEFAAATGERLEVHVKYVAATAIRNPNNETKFFSPSNTTSPPMLRVDQGLDIAQNATINVDRVQDYSFKASGGQIGVLFDGTEKLVSVDSFPWYNRSIFKP